MEILFQSLHFTTLLLLHLQWMSLSALRSHKASLHNLERIHFRFFLNARITEAKYKLSGCICSAKLTIFPFFQSFYQSSILPSFRKYNASCGQHAAKSQDTHSLTWPWPTATVQMPPFRGHLQGGLRHNPQLAVVRTLAAQGSEHPLVTREGKQLLLLSLCLLHPPEAVLKSQRMHQGWCCGGHRCWRLQSWGMEPAETWGARQPRRWPSLYQHW